MDLTYKSCIFCDIIFNIYSPHICESNANKIDDDTTIEVNSKINSTMINGCLLNESYNLKPDISILKKRKKKYGDELPSQRELYDIILQLSKKCESLQNDVNSLKSQYSRRLKRNIAEYLEYDQRPKYTFLEWVNSFVITDEILLIVFEHDLIEGIKTCIDNRIQSEGISSFPIRFFKDKPEWLFVYTDEPIITDATIPPSDHEIEKPKCIPVKIRLGAEPKDLLKSPTWRMVPKTDVIRIKEYISEQILKKFYIWEKENEPKMKFSSEKMDILTNHTLKVIGHGSKKKKNEQNTELYRWVFSKMAVS